MRSLKAIVVAAAGLVAWTVAGCGSSNNGNGQTTTGTGGATGGADAGPAQITSGPYEPLAINASWTYHVNDQGVLYDKVTSVQALEDAGGAFAGVMAYRTMDQFPTETQSTWYQVDGLVVKRLHDNSMTLTGALKAEDWYSPFRLRVDETPEHLVSGATWTLPFTDASSKPSSPAVTVSKTDSWKVDGVNEPIVVPAGSFLSLHVTRTDSSDGSTKSFWFVRGVGKVRESTSAGHDEQLASYQMP
jgi:hypothetical protein